jgi:hypothetical protein
MVTAVGRRATFIVAAEDEAGAEAEGKRLGGLMTDTVPTAIKVLGRQADLLKRAA